MKIYNVLTGRKQEFTPIEPGKVKIYACGITVNGEAHLGHARQAIVFNMMTEYLRFCGYQVSYARNYTDVDDKIIAQAAEEGISPLELSDKRIAATDEIMSKLLTRDADFKPRVSRYIPQIIDFISDLIAKGFAYSSDGDVYFSVNKYHGYGKLSNRNVNEMLRAVRVEEQDNKAEGLDFALWKKVEEGEFGWDSPWGRGRPGWHIECSTMIKSLLGDTIDIHGGGKDLIFPHHENEIAQSECENGAPLANYWIHNGLITVDGQKMSKSMNNFVTIRELLADYDPEVLRFLILSNHYASPLEVNRELLVNAERHLYRFYENLDSYRKLVGDSTETFDDSTLIADFRKCLDNDFNISLFLANLFGVFAEVNKCKGEEKRRRAAELMYVLDKVYPVTGLLGKKSGQFVAAVKQKYLTRLNLSEKDIEDKIALRAAAKSRRDFAEADAIRSELSSKGVVLMDSPEGTSWSIDFNAVK